MKEFKLEETSPLLAVDAKIWEMFDVFKSENISSDDYFVILFLLSAFKDGFLSTDLMNEKDNLSNRLIEQFHYSNNKLSNEYDAIIHDFEPLILRFSDKGLTRVFKLLAEINKQVLTENFPAFFDRVLYKISQSQGRFAGEFIQPVELTRFMCALADTKMGSKVFNPFAGLASFGIFLNEGQDYFGQELNQKSWALGVLRLTAYERSETKYVNEDSILNWPEPSEKFDLIISNPPLGLKLGPHYSEVEPNYRTVEPFLIEKGLQSLTENGKLVALLKPSFLFSNLEEKSLKEQLIKHDLIDTIVSFPGGILTNTSIPIIVILLNKRKNQPNQIKFVDATKFVVEKNKFQKNIKVNELLNAIDFNDPQATINISNSIIVDNDFNLSFQRYFTNLIEFKSEKNSRLVLLDDILNSISKPREISERGKIIKTTDLSNDTFSYTIDIDKLKDSEIDRSFYKLSQPALLLAKTFNRLKPSYCMASTENPVFVSVNIESFTINSKLIEIPYLIMQLNSEFIQKQLEINSNGTIHSNLKAADILNLQIEIPNLNIQESRIRQIALIEGYKKGVLFEKKTELNLQNKIAELEIEIDNQNNQLRHKIAGPASNLNSTIRRLKSILSNELIDLMDVENSTKDDLKKYLFRIERDSQIIVDRTKKLVNLNSEQKKINNSKMYFFEYINEYISEIQNRIDNNFKIELEVDDITFSEINRDNIALNISKNDFSIIIENLLENAISHAFTQDKLNLIKIWISLETDKLVFRFYNSGLGVQTNFNLDLYKRKGGTSGINSGNGYGGYLICKIVNENEGELTFEDLTKIKNKTSYSSVFEIKLKYYIDDK